MVDRRRSRWFACDAGFFDNSVGVMLRERFGPVGLVLWFGFLSACKRNRVPGQMEYGSVPDALSLMGLPGMELVNESGDPFELQSYWRALAAYKQCSTSSRGRLTQVRCTKWAKWQEGFGTEKEAERKSRSRATKTPDDVPPMSGRSPAVSPLARGEFDSDSDSDTDKDQNLASAPAERSTTALVVARQPDPLWEAVLVACGVRQDELTSSARGAANKAVAQLRGVHADPTDVGRRAGIYRRRWPDTTLTPSALAKHWAACAEAPTNGVAPPAWDVLAAAAQERAGST